MSSNETEIWRRFIQQRCGLYFSQNRLFFLRQRLWERMRQRAIHGYSEYYHYVAFNAHGEEEWGKLLELLLNHETGFFRHMPSFQVLGEFVLPELMKQKSRHGVNSISMWSAGCSTGQEVYSMAISFLELRHTDLPNSASAGVTGSARDSGWQVKVLGTDLNPKALEKARQGEYKSNEVRYMPEPFRSRYLVASGNGKNLQDTWQVHSFVRALTQFGHLNLSDPQSYWIPGQDVIFCQNVLLYFEAERRVEIVQRLCQKLNPGGYLFLAPAEIVGLVLPNIQLVRRPESLIYQRLA